MRTYRRLCQCFLPLLAACSAVLFFNQPLLKASPTSVSLGLSASIINFGNQSVAIPSAGRVLILSNRGSNPILIAGIRVTGDYGQTNTCNASLNVSENCTIFITFNPTVIGAR